MDRSSSLYDCNRLSLNTTNISSPIAESTHLNKSIGKTFAWGGKQSLAHQTHVTSNNLEKPTNKNLTTFNMSPMSKNMIDLRVYTDIHSKGLTSRVVKYHDDSKRLNRNLSVGNLYKKPGQFPIVHLNKNQIQYKANRNRPASVARIASPDKIVFHANTRSSILRTSSIVPSVSLRKTNSDLSCENRPILHPVESDLVPTRSVLDALKEISRKRINNDDLDGNDIIKRHCREAEDILPRSISAGIVNNSSSITRGSSFSVKRQREIQLSPNSKLNNSEQVFKKRMYTRNNDIASSLSSSLAMITPKRKLSEIQNADNVSGTSSSTENFITTKSKQPCNEFNNGEKQQIQQIRDKSTLNILQSPCMLVNHVTPLPPTPTIDERQNHPLKSYDSPMVKNVMATENKVEEIDNSTLKGNITSQKSRLTLFNKNYKDEELTKTLNSRKTQREHHEENEIKFVKPCSSSFDQYENNSVAEKINQSRLALMLKGLKGELNDGKNKKNGKDETDISQEKSNKTKSEETVKKSEEVKTTITLLPTSNVICTTSASMSFATNTTVSTSTISSAVALKSNTTIQNEQKETNSSGNSSGFSFGIKSNNVNSTSTTSGLISSSTVATTTASTGGFSFGLPSSTNENSKNVLTTGNTNPGMVVESSKTAGFAFNTSATGSTITSTSNENNANSTLRFNQGGIENFKNQQKSPTLSPTKSAFAPVSEIFKSTENKIEMPATATTNSPTSAFSFGLKTSNSQQLPLEKSSSGITSTSPSNTNSIFGNLMGNSQSKLAFKATESITTSTTVLNLPNQPQKFVFNSTSNNPQGGFSTSSNAGFSGFSSIVSQPSTTASSNFSTHTLGVQQNTTTNLFGVQTKNPSNTSPFGITEKSAFNTSATEAPKTSNLFENKSSTGGFTFGTIENSQETNTSKEKTSMPFTPFNSGHTSAGGFSFKNPTATTTAIASMTTPQKPQFSFSNAGNQVGSTLFAPEAASSTNQFLSTSTSGSFNFANPSKTTETAKPFSFNPSSQTQASFISSTSSTPAFSFGGNNNSISTENKQTPFSFGGGNLASNSTTCAAPNFSFTNSTSQNAFSSFNANKSSTGGFSFSSPTNNTEIKSTGFGTFNVASTTGQTQQVGQSSVNKFSFSSLSNAKIENKPIESSSTIFSPASGNPQSTQFGGQTKSFNFTGTANTVGSSQNLFSGSNTTSAGGSSIFGSSGTTALLKSPSSTSTFSFGSNPINQETSNNSAPFTFNSTGNSSGVGQQSNTSKPFTFGGSSNISNNFFSSTNSNIDSGKVPAFNFSTQNNNTGTTVHGITGSPVNRIQPSTNIFLGGPSNIDARPIKKATRRLNK